MYAIVYKEDHVPMCARLRSEGPDSVVFWSQEERARGFLAAKGQDFVNSFDVLRLDDDGLSVIARALGVRDEDIDLAAYPEQ